MTHYKPNIIYRWDARDDKIVPNVEPMRLFTELYRHTGLTRAEVVEDINEKKAKLDALATPTPPLNFNVVAIFETNHGLSSLSRIIRDL